MQMIADLHTHTLCATHAYNTFTEMAAAAKEIGYCALAVTDHAPAMPDSPHAWHFQNWSAMPREIGGVVMLYGAEARAGWTFRKASSKRRIGSSHPSIAPACRVC
jgi:putative hydrolase